jgi:hypothetical protein
LYFGLEAIKAEPEASVEREYEARKAAWHVFAHDQPNRTDEGPQSQAIDQPPAPFALLASLCGNGQRTAGVICPLVDLDIA